MFSYSCLILDFSCSAVLTFCFIMCQVFSLGDRSRLQETEVTVVVVLHDITWLKKTCIPLLFGLNGAFKAVGVTLLPITVFELFIDNSGSRLFMRNQKDFQLFGPHEFSKSPQPTQPSQCAFVFNFHVRVFTWQMCKSVSRIVSEAMQCCLRAIHW